MTTTTAENIARGLREKYPKLEGAFPDVAAPLYPSWLASVGYALAAARNSLRVDISIVARHYLAGHFADQQQECN